ncbi:hypothetical protein HG530_001526 [Fusarium avenaceum]|nr:hypothetical protein HG530_001526 [Fusarium avenaceum]
MGGGDSMNLSLRVELIIISFCLSGFRRNPGSYLYVRSGSKLDVGLDCYRILVKGDGLDIDLLKYFVARVAKKAHSLIFAMKGYSAIQRESDIRCVKTRETIKVVGVEGIKILVHVIPRAYSVPRRLFDNISVLTEKADMAIFVKMVPDEHLDKGAVALPHWAPSAGEVIGFVTIDASKLSVQLGDNELWAKDYLVYVEGFSHTGMNLIGPFHELFDGPVGETTESELSSVQV